MPKIERVDATVSGSPDDVSRRLKDQTALRLFPSSARPIVWGGRPLAGHVGARGLRVAQNRADLLGRVLPVAVGRLEPTAGGTRITAEVGMPRWLVYYLRAVWVLLVLLGVGGVGALATGFVSLDVAMVVGALALAPLAVAVSVGIHVAHADAQVEALAALLLRVADGEEPGADAVPERDRSSEPDRVQARAAARQPEHV